MKLIKELIAALNRHSVALEALSETAYELDNAAFGLQQAGYTWEEVLDKLQSIKVESVTQTN